MTLIIKLMKMINQMMIFSAMIRLQSWQEKDERIIMMTPWWWSHWLSHHCVDDHDYSDERISFGDWPKETFPICCNVANDAIGEMSTRAKNLRWLTRIKSVNSAGQLWQWMGLSAENELWWMIDRFLPNCPEDSSWTVFAINITRLPTNDTNTWPKIMRQFSLKWWLWWSVLWSKSWFPPIGLRQLSFLPSPTPTSSAWREWMSYALLSLHLAMNPMLITNITM